MKILGSLAIVLICGLWIKFHPQGNVNQCKTAKYISYQRARR